MVQGRCSLAEGSSSLALYEREAAAQDAGVSSEGSGFRGVSFHYIVTSSEAVDEDMSKAMAAVAGVVKEAAGTQRGHFGYFSDPNGYPGRSPRRTRKAEAVIGALVTTR
ncbi:MAG TPA: hypothetical protein VF195_05705 [Actinomycetota bacterium]